MAKKRYFDYKNKTLFEGHKLLEGYHNTSCPSGGPGHHCGFPKEFIEKTMKKVKRLLAENKKYKEISEKKDHHFRYILYELDSTAFSKDIVKNYANQGLKNK